MPTDNFSTFRQKFRIPRDLQKPCKAAQWGDGVLAAEITFPPDQHPSSNFADWPLGVVRDGLGGAFVLIASQTWFGAAQSPIALRPISGVGRPGPLIMLGDARSSVGVWGPWSDGAIVPSGSGRCIVAWGVDWTGWPEISVQRFDQAGTALWNNGNRLSASDRTWTGYSIYPAVEPDGSDGAIFAWLRVDTLPNVGQNSLYVLRLQRMTASGTRLWRVDGVAPGSTVDGPIVWRGGAPWPQLVPDGQGGALVLTIEGTNNCVVNRVDANGATIVQSVSLVPILRDAWTAILRIRRAVTDGAGGFYLGYVDSNTRLRILRYSPTSGIVWDSIVSTPINPRAFHLNEDDRGGVLVTFITSSGLELTRLDRNGNRSWSITPITVTLPRGSRFWSNDIWARVAQAIPDGNGGAILVFQNRTGASMPDLHSICFDSTGMPISPEQKVTGRPSSQEYPMVAPVGTSSGVVAWADIIPAVTDMDVYAQRLGCCPPGTIGTQPWPPFGCEIIQFGDLGFNQMVLQFPCGNRDRQIGIIPLSRLFSGVRGLDYPGSVFNRDVSPPGWIRISFTDLPEGTNIQLYSMKGKLLAESKIIPGDPTLENGITHLTFKPSAEDDSFLLFSTENKFEAGAAFTIGVRSEWGDGKPPAVIAPLTLSDIEKRAKLSGKRKSNNSNRVRKRHPKA